MGTWDQYKFHVVLFGKLTSGSTTTGSTFIELVTPRLGAAVKFGSVSFPAAAQCRVPAAEEGPAMCRRRTRSRSSIMGSRES